MRTKPGGYLFHLPVAGLHGQHEADQVIHTGDVREEEPYCGGSILDLVTSYGAKLRNTGFPSDASLNLLFHAALRLVERGELEAVIGRSPLPENAVKSYGNRRFFVPPDAEVSLSGVPCEGVTRSSGIRPRAFVKSAPEGSELSCLK